MSATAAIFAIGRRPNLRRFREARAAIRPARSTSSPDANSRNRGEPTMQVRFTSLGDGTQDEYRYLDTLDHALNRNLPSELIELFHGTDRETGYPVSAMR